MGTAVTNASVTVENIVIRPRQFLFWLALLGAVGFVATGIWMAVGASGLEERYGGLLGVVFFGWCGILILQRILSGWRMEIGPRGLTVPGPTLKSKLVPWSDIEGFNSFNIERQRFTGMKLRSSRNLIAQYSEAEVRRLLRRYRWLGLFSQAVVPAAVMHGDDISELSDAIAVTAHAKSLAELFAAFRRKYGAEVIFGWAERDRGAEAFAAYLESFRQHYAN